MELKELLSYRDQLINDSTDSEGYISDSGFLEICLPALNDTKYIDSTDVTNIYDPVENGGIKVNAYTCNESGERLQLFLVNEDSLVQGASDDQIMITQKATYEKQISRVLSFIKKSVKKQMGDLLQDASPSWVLVYQLGSADFLDQIDVIEIFLISATATVESRGSSPSAKMLDFEDEIITINYTLGNEKKSKDLEIKKRLIDLNFLYSVYIAEGSRYPLIVDFSEPPFQPVPYLQAANQPDFDSYLCSLPAHFLSSLYKKYSSRLLEKNVRSFLQLKGVNKGMQETIRKEPEKFIAYNNGLTITATDYEIVEYNGVSCIKSLSDFQIVNGGQTTATIYFSQKAGLPIDDIRVMAKINVAKNASEEMLDDLITKISLYSNAQSKVSKVDLRARSSQLIRLKSLSESVLTVSGKKWYFERAKGEYATMIRINSSRKSQLEKIYPKERRFTKEELAKYYSSWGDRPYTVKKGGEKIFRIFLEEISGEGSTKKIIPINRIFYEDLIARIILFKSLENIYGTGAKAIGQLRSAVVPYAISALFEYTTGDKKSAQFDMLRIWKSEALGTDLQEFFRTLMELMNGLIKKYSKSDDLGEYSKKEELWDDISSSAELDKFMNKPTNVALLKNYSVSAQELKRRERTQSEDEQINFEPLIETALIFDRGVDFYKYITNQKEFELSSLQHKKLAEIIANIQQRKDISENHLKFEQDLINAISRKYPDLLKDDRETDIFTKTVDFIIKKYNKAMAGGESVSSYFDAIKEIANKKNAKYYSVYGEIGRKLQNNEMPSLNQILQAYEFVRI